MNRLDQIKRQILDLKKERRALLLVHNYQRPEIQDLADHLGDSLDLSRRAAQAEEPVIVFCGVKFMAETAKILSPGKTVLLPRMNAGCPMAEMMDVDSLLNLKRQHPEAVVVTYVNSTAAVKAVTDVCCTSANAVKVVQGVESDTVIFAPDRHLASWVQRFTGKRIIPWDGYCYVHNRFTPEEIHEARKAHPDAVVVVHPECPAGVVDLADEVLSTSGMVRFAAETAKKTIVLGTEEGILHRLKKENPDKRFFTLGPAKMCRGMKTTRIEDLHSALALMQHEILLPDEIIRKAGTALERMLRYV